MHKNTQSVASRVGHERVMQVESCGSAKATSPETVPTVKITNQMVNFKNTFVPFVSAMASNWGILKRTAFKRKMWQKTSE